MYNNIPPHLSQQPPSAESNGSVESFVTQVPLPFHGFQHGNYMPETPYATRTFPQNGQFPGMPFHGHGSNITKLNPASPTYIPGAYPTPNLSFESQATFESNGDASDQPGSLSSGVTSYPQRDPNAQVNYANYQQGGAQGMLLQSAKEGSCLEYAHDLNFLRIFFPWKFIMLTSAQVITQVT